MHLLLNVLSCSGKHWVCLHLVHLELVATCFVVAGNLVHFTHCQWAYWVVDEIVIRTQLYLDFVSKHNF